MKVPNVPFSDNVAALGLGYDPDMASIERYWTAPMM
jgi:hypothetical protein